MALQHSRPYMPGYGIVAESEGAGLLPWSFIEERMEDSHNYWIFSTRPDGRPHAAPVWGIWHEGFFYFSTGDASRKGRNLASNPAIGVHLESGDEVVILEGEVATVDDQKFLKSLDKVYIAKYGVSMLGPGSIYQLNARRAFAWREKDFPESATRWIF
ncbi:MAG: pyridoxamine 5'-phosphate oxidase family protein [Anaerolineales bacterium]